MKLAIEYFVLMILLMFGILVSFNVYGLYHQNHMAHAYRDQISNLIENYDGDLLQVEKALEISNVCSTCSFKVEEVNDMVWIKVFYTMKLNSLSFEYDTELKGLSYLPNRSS